jgi:putative ABC transport system permease protein
MAGGPGRAANRGAKAFRLLLSLYPAAFRDEYRGELTLLFVDRYRDAAGPWDRATLWFDVFTGIAAEAPKEHCRMILQDLRYTLRSARHSPTFTAIVLVTLALGMGLNTAVYSLVHAALLRPLPYRESDRLVTISVENLQTARRDKVSGADLTDWRRRSAALQDFAWYWDTAFTLSGEVPATLPSWEVSANLFAVLGTRPLLGRALTSEDGRLGGPRVVVLSHRLWMQRFAGDPNVVGRSVTLRRADDVGPKEASYEIVGVMPAAFAHPNPTAALWAPLTADLTENRRLPVFHVIGRLHPGVSVERADGELKAIAAALAREHPDTNATRTAVVRGIREIYAGNVGASLWVLQGAALALLLIACTNVINLLLARAMTRDREVAIRLALGASRHQVFRQSLVEAVALACGGAAFGVLLAVWGADLLPRLLEPQLTNLQLPETPLGWMNPAVLGAVVGLTVLIGLALAVIPLLRSGQIAALVTNASQTASAPRWAVRTRAAFIVGQVALSLCLLIAAGLLVRSFVRLQDRSLGFRTDNVLTGFFFLPMDRYSGLGERELFLQQLTARLRALPHVDGAATISTLPLTGADARRPYRIPGAPAREDQWTQYRVVTPQYFDVMDIPLRRGRFFNDRDRTGSSQVAIVNESLARRLWPGEDPIGKVLLVADTAPPAQTREVVGVVGDVRHHGPATDIPLEVYRPAYQTTWPFFGLVVRTSDDPAGLIPSVSAAVASLDRTIRLDESLRPFDALAGDSVGLWQASMTLVSMVAAIALALALIGVYGLVTYVVAQRTREFGVRLALGAGRAHIYATVLRYGFVPVLVGILVGTACALSGTRVLQSLLFEVTPYDPLTFVVVGVTFLAVGTVAMLAPARHAATLNPMNALKHG